jgi:hypothetical protein
MGGFADIFESFFSGFSGGMGQSTRRRGPTRGDDLRLDLRLDFKEAVFGGEKEIKISHLETCGTCSGSGAKPGLGLRHVLPVVELGRFGGRRALPLVALLKFRLAQPVAVLVK